MDAQLLTTLDAFNLNVDNLFSDKSFDDETRHTEIKNMFSVLSGIISNAQSEQIKIEVANFKPTKNNERYVRQIAQLAYDELIRRGFLFDGTPDEEAIEAIEDTICTFYPEVSNANLFNIFDTVFASFDEEFAPKPE